METSPPSRGVPAGADVSDNRARLLQLGAALFASQGYAQVSVRDLAARLGVSTGAIYSNFRSKGDLLAEILEMRVRGDVERFQLAHRDLWLPNAVQDSFLRLPERRQTRALLLEAGAAARKDRELRDRLRPTLTALIDGEVGVSRVWQQSRQVDLGLDMADIVAVLWSIELGVGVLEAQGAMRSTPADLADFVGAALQSLERHSDLPTGNRRRTGGPVGRGRRRETSAPAFRHRRERTSASLPPRRSTVPTTQQKLVDVGMELFAERGYAAVTVRDIARASRLTTGSLYGNFANKAELLVEAIDLRLARDLPRLPADLIGPASPSDTTELDLTSFSGRAGLRALLVEGATAARSDPEVHDRLREIEVRHQDSWVQEFTALLGADGSAPWFEPRTLVTTLWSAELGLGLLEALDLPTPPPATLTTLFAVFSAIAGLEPAASHPPRRVARKQPAR